jgi:hypothetical protein
VKEKRVALGLLSFFVYQLLVVLPIYREEEISLFRGIDRY